MIKKIYDEINEWKNISVQRLEELLLLKYPYYPKQPTEQMQFLLIFHRIFTHTKVAWNPQITQIAKGLLRKITKISTKL